MRVTRYDRAWSWLLALLLLAGSLDSILFMVWLSNKVYVAETAAPVDLTEVGDGEGGGDGRPSGGTQLESPNDSAEPIPEMEAPPTDIADTMTAVTETMADQVAQLDDPRFQPQAAKGDYGSGGGSGGGTGPGRGLGHGKGKPGTPRRWQVRFQKGSTLEAYAAQLDFFKIEMGVLQPGNKVVYLKNFKGGKPERREGPADKETRYYLTWTGGDLQQADIDIFKRAGIDPGGAFILKFLPPEVEQQLKDLEKAKNGKEPRRSSAPSSACSATAADTSST